MITRFPLNMPEEKIFAVKFIVGPQIQTQVKSQNVSPIEAIGLLEMAKDQMLNNLRKGTKNVFDVQKRS